jgi:hypothetical protein
LWLGAATGAGKEKPRQWSGAKDTPTLRRHLPAQKVPAKNITVRILAEMRRKKEPRRLRREDKATVR